MVVAALTLDRLRDEAGDVVRVVPERRLGLVQRALLGRLSLGEMLAKREPDRRHLDPGPVEYREAFGLHRIGVGERERVSATAVERTGQVHHLRAQPGITPCG